jgi:hypothetical protein
MTDSEIMFNGLGEEEGSETFIFPGKLGFNFCKTQHWPYDDAVLACLFVAAEYFPDKVLGVHATGEDLEDWREGIILFARALRRAPRKLIQPISWEVNVVNSEQPDRWSNTLPGSLPGSEEEIIEAISARFPDIQWEKQSMYWVGQFWPNGLSARAYLEKRLGWLCRVEFYGEGDPLPFLDRLCTPHGWLAVDSKDGSVIELAGSGAPGWERVQRESAETLRQIGEVAADVIESRR